MEGGWRTNPEGQKEGKGEGALWRPTKAPEKCAATTGTHRVKCCDLELKETSEWAGWIFPRALRKLTVMADSCDPDRA